MTSLVPEFVRLAGGSFLMGNDIGRPDERPAHLVTVRAFAAAVSPVSNAEYSAFVQAAGAAPAPFLAEERFASPGQPVVGINWFEAAAFCDWLSSITGKRCRLPTEGEREYAALGGLASGDWPWAGSNEDFVAWVNTLEAPHVPTEACANGFGLRCMAENVHEWCGDWYDPNYYAISPRVDPRGPEDGKRRVSRGGSWRHREKTTRINARASLDPSFHYSDFGFRVYHDA